MLVKVIYFLKVILVGFEVLWVLVVVFTCNLIYFFFFFYIGEIVGAPVSFNKSVTQPSKWV